MGRGWQAAAPCLFWLFWLFWLAWGAAHLGAWVGSRRGGFLLGVMADSSYLLAQCGAALGAALCAAALGGAAPGWAPPLALSGAGAMWLLNKGAVARAGARGVPSGTPLREGAFALLQANVEGKGNPSGWDFDAAALCEMWGGPLEAPEGMALVAGAVEGRCDAALYSRLPVLDSGEAGPAIDGWVQAVWARLLWRGSPVVVVSIHTRAPISAEWSAQRDAFLRSLPAFLDSLPKGDPVVLAGDWNITPAGAVFQELMAGGAFSQEPDALRPTWRADCARFGIGFRIDRTVCSRGAHVQSWRAMPKGEADHLASVSTIVFARPAASSAR